MTENTLENTKFSISKLFNSLSKDKLIYLGIAIFLVGVIIYYLKYIKKSEKLLNTQNFNNELLQQLQQPQMQQSQMQPQVHQPQFEYPKKIMMDYELAEELKTKNMTPQDYIFELQKTGEFPPGPMPEIVIDNQNIKRVEQSNVEQNNQKMENNLNNLKLDEDDNDEDNEDNEDDNLREENLSKEEMDNIREQLLKLQKPATK